MCVIVQEKKNAICTIKLPEGRYCVWLCVKSKDGLESIPSVSWQTWHLIEFKKCLLNELVYKSVNKCLDS